MRILCIAKRWYTNKDALAERFGRVFELPSRWHRSGHPAQLELIDYRGAAMASVADAGMRITSHPYWHPATVTRLRRSARKFAPDVVVASGDCLVGLSGLALARMLGARFVFDAYDDYRSFGSHRIFLGWDAFSWICRRSDLVLYASASLAAQHAWTTPWHLAGNGVDPARFDLSGLDPDGLRAGHGLPRRDAARVIGYVGSMERDRGVNVLIEAISLLRRADPSLLLVIAGRRSAETPLEPEWIRYRGIVPHLEVPALLASCDVLALPYLRSAMMDAGASCKIAEYLFSRRPVAATRSPNLIANFPAQAAQLDDRLADPGDAADLARCIRSQLDQPIVASVPGHMDWGVIAAETLAAIARV